MLIPPRWMCSVSQQSRWQTVATTSASTFLFAINHTHIWTVLLVYGVLLLLWSLAGKRMGNHTHVLRAADRYAHFIVPLVFVGLGVYILAGIE